MADSHDDQRGNGLNTDGVPRKIAQWTANHFVGWIITSLLGGTGAAVALNAIDILELEKVVQAATKGIDKELAVLSKRQEELSSEQEVLNREIAGGHKAIQDHVARVVQELRNTRTEMRTLSLAANGSREDLSAGILSNRNKVQTVFEFLNDDVSDVDLRITELDGDVKTNHRAVMDAFEGLFERLDSYHRTFVDEMNKLADEGGRLANERTITEEHLVEAEAWIAKVNYMLRSLPIPTEAGLLRDTSVVKEDLRKAMKAFEKEDELNTRMAHVRRVLVIVEAMRDLASSGRIPQLAPGSLIR